jgi:hypothetical protein
LLVCTTSYLQDMLVKCVEQYYRAKMMKEFSIIENKLAHNMYGCYQPPTGNMDKHYECYTSGDSPYKGLGLPDLEYF